LQLAKYIYVHVIHTRHQGHSVKLQLASVIYLYAEMDPATASQHLLPSIRSARRAIAKATQEALCNQSGFSGTEVWFEDLSLELVAALEPSQAGIRQLSTYPLIFSYPPVPIPRLFELASLQSG